MAGQLVPLGSGPTQLPSTGKREVMPPSWQIAPKRACGHRQQTPRIVVDPEAIIEL
jgi:hypothetical protein